MSETMYMPNTVEEFIDDFKFTDSKEVYTNGAELIQVLRVKQMLDHYYNHAKSTEDMTFGDALEALKQGQRVARKGWNGKNQYVELACCISYVNREQLIVNVDHKNIGNKALAFVGTSGVQLGWLASQADMLAEDWYIVE